MMHSSFSRLKIAATAALALLALAVAPAASAHTSLIDASPASGDVVTELTDLRLEFSEELLNVGNSARITDADGTSTDLVIDLSVPRVLTAPLPADLAPGAYVIDWRVVANDGHPLEDSIDITYEPEGGAATVAPSPSATAASPAEDPAQSPVASPTPEGSEEATPTASASAVAIGAPVDATDDSDGGSVWWWIIAIGLVVGIGIGFIMFKVGRKSGVNSGDEETPTQSPGAGQSDADGPHSEGPVSR